MNARVADTARFYDLLDRLAVRVGGLRVLADCTGTMKWPRRGVYFFYEDGETRSGSGQRPPCRARRDARAGERLPGPPSGAVCRSTGERLGPGAATTVSRSSACSWARP